LAKLIGSVDMGCDFMLPMPPDHDVETDDFEETSEPIQPQIGGSLKNLEHYLIKGDLRRCVICNEKFECAEDETAASNLPRVLYCGDCLCEQCISKYIQRASVSDAKIGSVAACQLTCPVCCMKHIFKLTKTGYLICNDKYIKMQDDKGPVNFFPASKLKQQGVSKGSNLLLMDHSIAIPPSLVIRSLPINVEILDLIRLSPNVAEQNLDEPGSQQKS